MDSGTAAEMIKAAPLACEKCGSMKVLVFFERKIDRCLAIACLNCEHFQIYGRSLKEINDWFRVHGVS